MEEKYGSQKEREKIYRQTRDTFQSQKIVLPSEKTGKTWSIAVFGLYREKVAKEKEEGGDEKANMERGRVKQRVCRQRCVLVQ